MKHSSEAWTKTLKNIVKTSCQGKDTNTQVHLTTTRHPRCGEELSSRCSLDADASGASDERPRGSHQLHHSGYSQAVRLGTLTLRCAGSNPAIPIWFGPFMFNKRSCYRLSIASGRLGLRENQYGHEPGNYVPSHHSTGAWIETKYIHYVRTDKTTAV